MCWFDLKLESFFVIVPVILKILLARFKSDSKLSIKINILYVQMVPKAQLLLEFRFSRWKIIFWGEGGEQEGRKKCK